MYWNQGNPITKNNNNNSNNNNNNKTRSAIERKNLSIGTNYCFVIGKKNKKIVYDCILLLVSNKKIVK